MDSGIHKGLNTHHHDQSIKFVSLSPMNRIASKSQNPIPPLFDEILVLIIIPHF